MTTTIDRLARAAYEASDAPAIYGAWDSGPGPHQEHQRYWHNQVRAILRELREPSDEMLWAAHIKLPPATTQMRNRWRAMIDHILAEKP